MPSTTFAQSRSLPVAIPGATLDTALIALAQASGVEIVSTEAGLHRVITRPIRGRMTVKQALGRLLAGSGYHAVANRGGGYRIVVAPRRRPTPRPPEAPPPPPPAEIVVTASKQRVPLLRYPGSLTLIAGSPTIMGAAPGAAPGDISDLPALLPILQSTQLGPGRNKVFIRGVADSSFNGTTQSTASVYLDDVQLNASGPDPALRLYDMQSVEVMEGPQGTLYGVGAIGGVLRLTSHAPQLDHIAGSVAGGIVATAGGAPGADGAAMVNVPLVPGRVAVRGVAYASRDGGYIDDRARGAKNIDRTDTIGMRLALRADPGAGWRIETSGVGQRIRTRDGRYAEAEDGPRARSTTLAQPFAGRFLFARLVIAKDWDSGLRLVSATGLADYRTRDRFDASALLGPGAGARSIAYDVATDKLLLSQEARLSRSLPNGLSWLTGFALVSDRSVLSRALGMPTMPIDIVGVTNVTRSASAFAEATVPVLPDLSVTLGARVTTARVDGEPSSTRGPGAYIHGRSTRRFDPTIALSYRIAPAFAAFARYQTGFRTGGLAVAQGIGRVANYQPDSIGLVELGLRRLRERTTGLGLSLSVSSAHWTRIQADLLNRRGQPFTTNLGDARINAVEGAIDWVPVARFAISGSALVTENTVRGAVANQSQMDNRRLANTPPFAGQMGIAYTPREGGAVTPRVSATLAYVGRSVLGTGDLLDVSQGDYTTVGAAAGVRWGAFDLTLALDNLTDTGANRFAFGNPFGLAARDQITPLRPRTLRLGLATAW